MHNNEVVSSVVAHIKRKYGDSPEFLWENSPHYAVIRHHDSLKWYAVILRINSDKLIKSASKANHIAAQKSKKQIEVGDDSVNESKYDNRDSEHESIYHDSGEYAHNSCKSSRGDVDMVSILNLKCNPALIGELRDNQHYFTAYHMNKEHWVTIVLNDTLSLDNVYTLVDMSYNMTKRR